MSEMGYGRGWSEPKANGWRRIVQMCREPNTKTALWYSLMGMMVGVWFMAFLGALSR